MKLLEAIRDKILPRVRGRVVEGIHLGVKSRGYGEGKYWAVIRVSGGNYRVWGPIREFRITSAPATAKEIPDWKAEAEMSKKISRGYEFTDFLRITTSKAEFLQCLNCRVGEFTPSVLCEWGSIYDLVYEHNRAALAEVSLQEPNREPSEPEHVSASGPEPFSSEVGNGKSRLRGLLKIGV